MDVKKGKHEQELEEKNMFYFYFRKFREFFVNFASETLFDVIKITAAFFFCKKSCE